MVEERFGMVREMPPQELPQELRDLVGDVTARKLWTRYGDISGIRIAVENDSPMIPKTVKKKLKAAFFIHMALTAESVSSSPSVLGGAEEAHRFLKPRLRDQPCEIFAVILLSQKHGVLAYRELFKGSISASAVHPREVVKAALKDNAAAVILAHNHPSGQVAPSPDDLHLTERLKAVLSEIDVRVVDHIIVGSEGYFSFAREGII